MSLDVSLLTSFHFADEVTEFCVTWVIIPVIVYLIENGALFRYVWSTPIVWFAAPPIFVRKTTPVQKRVWHVCHQLILATHASIHIKKYELKMVLKITFNNLIIAICCLRIHKCNIRTTSERRVFYFRSLTHLSTSNPFPCEVQSNHCLKRWF